MEVMLLVLIAGWILLFGFYIPNRILQIEKDLAKLTILFKYLENEDLDDE